MAKLLVSWIGTADLHGINPGEPPGPLIRILQAERFDVLYALHNQPSAALEGFTSRLPEVFKGELHIRPVTLSSPIHFGDIYKALDAVLDEATKKYPDRELSIQLTSGTPAMSAVSILVGKTKYPARFMQASREQGVQEAELPFDIMADFLPGLADQQDKRLPGLMASQAPDTAAFDDIVSQSPIMLELKQRAAILAQRNLPVLIYGETGTGKELFAKAIRNSSSRATEPFLVLNCGAIPRDLVDAMLFGHTKGAFTGATESRQGFFEQADGGTLFLDEFGELPLESQVRLLRVLQDGTFTPLGSTKEKKVDVRIIAASNRNLMEEVAKGSFREDLFYRVAIGVLHLPPLRERTGDLPLLTDSLLARINAETLGQDNQNSKKISVKARKVIQQYTWPGNIRELHATLLRATLWQTNEVLEEADIREALLTMPTARDSILGRELSQQFDFNELVSEVYRHYIERALRESHGNKRKAAELLGLKNYQTLSNWMEKYHIE